MNETNYSELLKNLKGFRFNEFAFNVINEPFLDNEIEKKIRWLVDTGYHIDSLFFSSNWLVPKERKIDDFVDLISTCCNSNNIKSISVNATISGIDQKSYDLLQGGKDLKECNRSYRKLDFYRAVKNICYFLRKIACFENERLPLVFRIKAYGDLFKIEQMSGFWSEMMTTYGVPPSFQRRHVKILLNNGFTTFARSYSPVRSNDKKYCNAKWLEDKLAIDANGNIKLCCNDGIENLLLGNLVQSKLYDIISADTFQDNLEIVKGLRKPNILHPCMRCEFFY